MSEPAAQAVDPPGRIVSLVPSLTETLFELGVGERVVGATKFCVRPSGSMGHVTRVGGTKDPKLRVIQALQPDLVLMNQEENRLEDAEALGRCGIRVEVTYPRTVAQVPTMLRRLGVLVGAPEAGDALGRALEQEIQRAAASYSCRPVSFLVLVWRGPWIGASDQTFLSDLLGSAGGENVLKDRARPYPDLSGQEIRRLGPERVLLPSEPFPFQERYITELIEATGFPRECFVPCDGELLTWHGSRTIQGLREARGWLRRKAPSSSR